MNPSERIDKQIADLADWRGKMLANLRKLIHDADPEIIEEWKWMGSPCWSHDGLICVGNGHKDKVRLTFDQGASLPDPSAGSARKTGRRHACEIAILFARPAGKPFAL